MVLISFMKKHTLDIPYNTSDVNPISEFAEVKESAIHGLGLFAKKKIPRGTIWWHPRPQDIQIFTKDQIRILINSHKNQRITSFLDTLLMYSYYDREFDVLVFCFDNARFVNHSKKDNSGALEDHANFQSVALKDIEIGEEITENYRKYTPCEWIKDYKPDFDVCCW